MVHVKFSLRNLILAKIKIKEDKGGKLKLNKETKKRKLCRFLCN